MQTLCKRLLALLGTLALACSGEPESIDLGQTSQSVMTATTVRVKYEREWNLSGSGGAPYNLDGWLGYATDGAHDVPEGTLGTYTCTNSTPPSNPTYFSDTADQFGQFKRQIPSEETCDLRVHAVRVSDGPGAEDFYNEVFVIGSTTSHGYVDILDIDTGFQQVTLDDSDDGWEYINTLAGLVHVVGRFMDPSFDLDDNSDYVRAAYSLDIQGTDGVFTGAPKCSVTSGFDMTTCAHELGHGFLDRAYAEAGVGSKISGFGHGADPDYPDGCEIESGQASYSCDAYFDNGREMFHEAWAQLWAGLAVLEDVDDLTNPANGTYYAASNGGVGAYQNSIACSHCPFAPDYDEFPLFSAPYDPSIPGTSYISSGRYFNQYKALVEAIDSRSSGGTDCLPESSNIPIADFLDAFMDLDGNSSAEGHPKEGYIDLSYRFGNAYYETDAFTIMEVIDDLSVSSGGTYNVWANACYFAAEWENNTLENWKTGVAF